MIKDVVDGRRSTPASCGGPLAGYYAPDAAIRRLWVVPLTQSIGGHPPGLSTLAWGCGFFTQDWKRELNRLIHDDQPEINKLLLSYGVPLLGDQDQLITQVCSEEVKRRSLLAAAVALAILGLRCAVGDEVALLSTQNLPHRDVSRADPKDARRRPGADNR